MKEIKSAWAGRRQGEVIMKFKIQCRDSFGNWDESVIGPETQIFETREGAEAAITDLRTLGPDWTDAEYRVVEEVIRGKK